MKMASPRPRRILWGFVFILPMAAALCLVWFALKSAPPEGASPIVYLPPDKTPLPPLRPRPPPGPDVDNARRSPAWAPPRSEDRALALPSEIHEFPWPPPTPSTSYRIPDTYFGDSKTIGAVTDQITRALETSGYVERRYYTLPVTGIALVTRLEHFNEDGSPANERWASVESNQFNLYRYLRGLYFTDPGHYRVIVFLISQDLPSRSAKQISINDTKEWLGYGLDDIPAGIASQTYKAGHTLAYIYDFVSSDGRFTIDREPPPAQEQLKRAGVLTALSAVAR